MKILFVTEYYAPHIGGVEIVVQEVAERLVRLGHKVYVVTSRVPHSSAHYEEINGVKVHRISVPKKGGRYWFDSFLPVPEILKLGRSCHIIHVADYVNAFPAWLASKLLTKKSVMTVHEPLKEMWRELMGMNYFSAKLHQFAERILLLLPFHKYVCVSESTAKRLRSINRSIKDENLTVIYNGLDNESFNPSKADGSKVREELNLDDGFIYMSFGRPGISKGIEYLIGAVPLIARQIPHSKLLLILSRNPEDRYKVVTKMIQDLDIGNKVVLLDPVSRNELPNYIAASDCVVVPSLSEGFGFTAAEACAMGKPVVATNVGSLPEVVSGKYVLVEPRNPEAIAEGVEKVYKGEVEDSPRKVFSWYECVERYLKVYEQLIRNNESISS